VLAVSDAEKFDARWRQVTCSDCGRTYQCTPQDDYYNSTTAGDGVCLSCLVLQWKLPTTVIMRPGVEA